MQPRRRNNAAAKGATMQPWFTPSSNSMHGQVLHQDLFCHVRARVCTVAMGPNTHACIRSYTCRHYMYLWRVTGFRVEGLTVNPKP